MSSMTVVFTDATGNHIGLGSWQNLIDVTEMHNMRRTRASS